MIGLSILSGSHRELIPDVLDALRAAGGGDDPRRRRRDHPRGRRRAAARGGRRGGLHAEGLRAHADPARHRRARGGAQRDRRRGVSAGDEARAGGGARRAAARSATSARRPPRSTCSRTGRPRGAARSPRCSPRSPPPRSAARRPAHVVGVTGPPGAGKSTLLSALVARLARARPDASACSPSTRRRSARAARCSATGRGSTPTRPTAASFIRSMAAGERLGGLAPATRAAAQALAAAFDVVVIETVGVGQSETEVAEAADTVAVVVQPGSGDVLQFLKAGIMEVPDVLVVTKADLGAVAAARGRATCARRCARSATGAPVRRGLVDPPRHGDRGAGRRARRSTAPGSTCERRARARAGSARWPTSSPSTASAGCARSAAAAPRSASCPSRTRRSRARRSSARSRRAPPE